MRRIKTIAEIEKEKQKDPGAVTGWIFAMNDIAGKEITNEQYNLMKEGNDNGGAKLKFTDEDGNEITWWITEEMVTE